MDKKNKIDMSEYRPYEKSILSCEVREIKEKRITWPDVIKKDLGNGVVSRII